MTISRLMLAAVLAAGTACTPPESPAMDPPPSQGPAAPADGDTVPLRRFGEDVHSRVRFNGGLAERGEQVVRDPAAWSALWRRMTAGQSPSSLPAVDFGSEMVLVAAMGQRSSGGYAATIDRVESTPSALMVHITHQSPGPRCGAIAAVTAPVDVARIPRSDRPVRWSVREVVRDCP
ncbi:MAG TPA: protease complex subunit PrcB family protein [Longimicrobium sp.]|nr:protease complex subunit PrcB family protein [Longimicrobium sp.]